MIVGHQNNFRLARYFTWSDSEGFDADPLPDMPFAVSNFAVCNYENKKIYVSSGNGKIVGYDLKQNEWNICPKNLENPRRNHSMCCLNKKLYHFFGINSLTSRPESTVEITMGMYHKILRVNISGASLRTSQFSVAPMNDTEVIIFGLGGKLWSLDADWRKQDETRVINELPDNRAPGETLKAAH